ncbi:MAG: reverse transcriptase domain-containing protein [Candidatus Paceibacteria bacterium]
MLWQRVHWRLVESRITRLQLLIYRASKLGRTGTVKRLQEIVTRSLDAKLLAVRHVTTISSGRNTPGVDRHLYHTPDIKMKLALHLSVNGKSFNGKAAPIRRFWVRKPGKWVRKPGKWVPKPVKWVPKPGKPEPRPLGIPVIPLGIPVIRDRAKQKLVLFALEPAWEAKFEPNSFGFRPGRSTHDAMECILRYLRSKDGSRHGPWILDADLKGCFDRINHDYLLAKLGASPKITAQVRAWLKAGIFEGLYIPTEEYGLVPENRLGTPQGGIISPFLANVALHGMEEYLKHWILSQSWEVPISKIHHLYSANKIKSIGVIRYADDFVVIHRNKGIVERAQTALSDWLANTSGLSLNTEKTRIVHSNCGFDFLGFSFIYLCRNKVGKVKIYPSKNNQKKLIDKVRELCVKYRSISTFDLIGSLRPVILGWANYFRFVECKDTFSKLDFSIFGILRSWVFRRDKRHGRFKTKERYFPSGKVYRFDGREYQNNWILWGKAYSNKGKLVERFLPRMSWVASRKHVSVRGDASVYDGNVMYWAQRSRRYGNVSTIVRTLLTRQRGFCPICRGPLVGIDLHVHVDHLVPRAEGGSDRYDNLQLVHIHCHLNKRKSLTRLATFPAIGAG